MAALLALAGAAACGGGSDRGGGASDKGVGVVSATPLIPATDVVDLVSYGDHVLVVTVTSERELPAEQEIKRGEGMIMREVSLSVDRLLWSRDGARTAPASIQANAAGWIMHDGKRKPFAMAGDPRLEAGNTYIVAVFRLDERGYDADDWMPFAVLSYNDEQIGRGEQAGGTSRLTGVLAKTQGQSADALSALLAATSPDPISVKYAHLEAPERYRATAAEKFPLRTDRPS